MKLLVKFNLLYILLMALGIGVSGYITKSLLQQQAQEEALDKARLLIDKANAVRGYTSGQITKLLETQMKYEFLPQSVPSYSAVEVLGALKARYPEYFYKEATLNPTNPRDRAAGWEVDVVNMFRGGNDLKETVGQRDTPTGTSLYVARPLRITNPACLVCHSSVEAAPKTLVDRYGSANGFGWQLNEVIGAQIVSIPLEVPLKRANQSWVHCWACSPWSARCSTR
jgi:protein-histidine pros-kinase